MQRRRPPGSRRFRPVWTRLVVGLVVALAACSSDTPDGSDKPASTDPPDPAIVADSSLADPAQNASNGEPVEEPGFVQADANTATSAQLVSTFEANGIDQAATWATAVIAHRPYGPAQADGAEFDQLLTALEQAGLDDLTAGAVIASLTV